MKQYNLPRLAIILLLSIGNVHVALSQGENSGSEEIVLKTATGVIYGTLALPLSKETVPVALIISGSGPTDRNGNNPAMRNNSLKMLADSLFNNGIASVRYDKRGIAQSKNAGAKEEDLRFDAYVSDAAEWINLLRMDKRFSSVIIIGHSEGSLIGMLAAQKTLVNGFVSIAGAGQSADKVLKEQLKKQPQAIIDMTYPIIDSLVAGKNVKNVNPMLNTLFRSTVQPYLMSWFKYDPVSELNKLSIPILIIQGTNDIQVGVKDADVLVAGNKNATLVFIERMNHVLKDSDADPQRNIATYSNPELPIVSDLVVECVDFIRSCK